MVQSLLQMTVSLRVQMPRKQQARLDEMDERQHAWMASRAKRIAAAEASGDDMGGRQSGPEEWRRDRDELGELAPRPATKLVINCTSRSTVKRVRTARRSALTDVVKERITALHDDSDFYLFGNARRSPGGGILLTDGPDQTSAFFFDASLPRNESWAADLHFRITVPKGKIGADGMALIFTSKRGLGRGGFGMGYDGLGGSSDWAIEGRFPVRPLGIGICS